MSDAPIGGADFLIIEAIKAGRRTVPQISAWAKIEPLAVRAAVNRLRTSGRLRRYGNTRFARYVLVKRRAKPMGARKAPTPRPRNQVKPAPPPAPPPKVTGTCEMFATFDMNCPLCGLLVKGGTAHKCKRLG